jgi:hypothetical protein
MLVEVEEVSMKRSLLAVGLFALLAVPLSAQQPPARGASAAPARGNPADTEVWQPVPAIITPGQATAPPSDAIVLFDGSNLNEWVSTKDQSPAAWTVADGSLKTPASVTALHNGVLIQNHFELKGETLPFYKKYESAPIKLQGHGDPSPPISFRNIWVRELP